MINLSNRTLNNSRKLLITARPDIFFFKSQSRRFYSTGINNGNGPQNSADITKSLETFIENNINPYVSKIEPFTFILSGLTEIWTHKVMILGYLIGLGTYKYQEDRKLLNELYNRCEKAILETDKLLNKSNMGGMGDESIEFYGDELRNDKLRKQNLYDTQVELNSILINNTLLQDRLNALIASANIPYVEGEIRRQAEKLLEQQQELCYQLYLAKEINRIIVHKIQGIDEKYRNDIIDNIDKLKTNYQEAKDGDKKYRNYLPKNDPKPKDTNELHFINRAFANFDALTKPEQGSQKPQVMNPSSK